MTSSYQLLSPRSLMPRSRPQDSPPPKLYRISPNEQSRLNWVVFRNLKAPRRLPPSPYVPSTVRTLLGYHRGVGGVFVVRPRYANLVCAACHRFDSDRIFEAGFDDDVSIRFRDDFAVTDDFIFVIGQRMLDVLRKGRVKGYEVKTVDRAGWYAMRVTHRVDSDPSVFRYEKGRCKACGRPVDGGGGYGLLSQVEPPASSNTFFTTKLSCLARDGPDRDLFCTEDVVMRLKEKGIRKGSFDRLWTNEEIEAYKAKTAQGVFSWYPPKRTIYLS